jgi:hypothetical protein
MMSGERPTGEGDEQPKAAAPLAEEDGAKKQHVTKKRQQEEIKNQRWRRRKGRGEEEKDPSSLENHTDGGGEPHKELVYLTKHLFNQYITF